MADQNKVKTMQLSGNDYAKVADRLKEFRSTFEHAKTESAYDYDVDQTVVFTVWLWKDKNDLLELMKAGVTDKEILRSSADANGSAKGQVGQKQKDFEKLESIALGRALAMLGFLASGEIASFEEMEAFQEFQQAQQREKIDAAIGRIKVVESNEELNKVVREIGDVLRFQEVIDAGKSKREELAAKAAPGPDIKVNKAVKPAENLAKDAEAKK